MKFIGMKITQYIYTIHKYYTFNTTFSCSVQWQLSFIHQTTGGATQQLSAARLHIMSPSSTQKVLT